MSSLFCCRRREALAPARPEEAPDPLMKRIAHKCTQAACDVLVYTFSGMAVGSTIGGMVAYLPWSKAHNLHRQIEGAMEARERLLEEDPSMSFMTSLLVLPLAIERNKHYISAMDSVKAGPIFGAFAGFCIGSTLVTARLLRNVLHLHTD